MQYIEFKEILKERYKTCIYVYTEPGITEIYPNLLKNFQDTWKRIEDLGTCPYKFRLVYREPDILPDEVKSTVDNLSYAIADPSVMAETPELPWLQYWIKLFFDRNQLTPYLFLDIPICIIYLCTVPQKLEIPFPQWATDFTKNIAMCNIVVNPQYPPSKDYYLCKDESAEGLYDHILNITHFKASHMIKEMKETTTTFVRENWHGFGNSVRRLLGFSGRISRATLVLTLKQLGDLCLAIADYENASIYYQQLYQELVETDPKVEESLMIVMAVSSLLSTDELNLRDFFLPTYKAPATTFPFYQSMFIMSYYCATHNDLLISSKILMRLIKMLIKGDNPFKVVAYPILFEAASYCLKTSKSLLLLFRAANSYGNLHLHQNEKICLWKIFNSIHGCGWQNLEEFLLLKVAATDDIPYELHNVLQHRSLDHVQDIVKYLRELELDEPVPIGSVSVHNVSVLQTGFPMSPPPIGISLEQWSQIRKKLFPVVAQSSTDKFVASAWGSDLVEETSVGVGEIATVNFTLQPLQPFNATNLTLTVEGPMESEIIESVDIEKAKMMTMKLKSLKTGVVTVRGVSFLWNGVAPVFAAFQDPLRFDCIKDPPLINVSCECERNDTFPNHPVKITLKTSTVVGRLTSLHVVVNTTADIEMISPRQSTGQRHSLDSQVPETVSVFSTVCHDVCKYSVDFLVSYTAENHVVRFAHCRADIDCCEFPPLTAISGNDTILLRSDAKIEEVSSEAFDVVKQGDVVKIEAPKKIARKLHSMLTVKREVKGIETIISVKIPDIFVRFLVHSEIATQVFPFYVDMALEVITPHDGEHRVEMKQPKNSDFFVVGKTTFSFSGMLEKFMLKVLVIRPFTFDIGELLSVDGISRFHKVLSVK